MIDQFNQFSADVNAAEQNPLLPVPAKIALVHARDLFLSLIYRIEALEKKQNEKHS